MAYREYVTLFEECMVAMGRMNNRCSRDNVHISGYPRQLMVVLVRLYLGGRARLKDIAAREMDTTANLCAAFRRLERDGMVMRSVDEHDRRNTWYCVTPDGAVMAQRVLNNFRNVLENIFADITPQDEDVLVKSLKNINSILAKMEKNNATA